MARAFRRFKMSQKKPIWTTTEAHKRLKEYCKASGRTQLEVVSELILTNLDPDNPGVKPAKTASAKAASKPASTKKKGAKSDNKPFGGVWVV